MMIFAKYAVLAVAGLLLSLAGFLRQSRKMTKRLYALQRVPLRGRRSIRQNNRGLM